MIPGLSPFVTVIFILTTILTAWFFLFACNFSRGAILIMLGWLAFQGFISFSGFYQVTDSMPPRFALMAPPAILFFVSLFFTKSGNEFIRTLDIKWLTYLHFIRVPVELSLYFLFLSGMVPQLMTFEGSNPDILSGITAPIAALIIFRKGMVNKKLLLIWNIVCLALLFNIVIRAVLSAPTPFQEMAFDMPNRGILYFPFAWLPSFIVPVVFFSHLVAIRYALSKDNQ